MKIFAIALLLTPLVCFTSQKVLCYSGSHLIYSAEVDKVQYDSGLVFFTEVKSNKIFMSNASCMFEVKDSNVKKISKSNKKP